MALLAPDPTSTDEQLERELLIREARCRQRHRRLTALLLLFAAVGAYLAVQGGSSAPPRPASLLSRPLHFPSLGAGGRCPVSSGYMADNSYFGGGVLGHGPVRVLLANAGDVPHGRAELGTTGAHGWYALQTLWFAMPSYNGPFVVRGARLGARGRIEVQPGGSAYSGGQLPRSGPLVVPAGPTINTYYTNWRRGHVRDAVTGRLVPTLTGYGYRTVPGSTWVRSPGCYAWQVDGRGFSEDIVVDATPNR